MESLAPQEASGVAFLSSITEDAIKEFPDALLGDWGCGVSLILDIRPLPGKKIFKN